MSSKERNTEIRRLYEIEGWSQESIALKYGLSERQVRRIVKVDSPVDISAEKILNEIQTINYENKVVPKYALFKDNQLIQSSDNINDFEELTGKLSTGKMNWLKQRLEENTNAILGEYEIRLSKNAKEDKESQTLETALKRIEMLEKTLLDIMQNTTDHAIINSIKKNLKV